MVTCSGKSRITLGGLAPTDAVSGHGVTAIGDVASEHGVTAVGDAVRGHGVSTVFDTPLTGVTPGGDKGVLLSDSRGGEMTPTTFPFNLQPANDSLSTLPQWVPGCCHTRYSSHPHT